MSNTFNLPDLGEGLTEADLVRWLVAEGDEVAVDQAIAEVETAKALVEVPCPYAGTVLTLHGAEGDTLEVGSPFITVGEEGESADDGGTPGALSYREEERAGVREPAEAAAKQPALDKARGGDGDDADEASGNVLIGYGTSGHAAKGRTRPSKRRRGGGAAQPAGDVAASAESGARPAGAAPRVSSPIVRKLARETGVDVAALTGTGPDGMITRADVLAAGQSGGGTRAAGATSAASTPQGGAPSVPAAVGKSAEVGEHDAKSGLRVASRTPITGVRKAIAEQMVRSRQIIPDVTAWLDVDVTGLLELRAALKAKDPENAPSLLGLIARFTVAGLRKYPVMNARIETGTDGREEIVEFEGVHLGLAVQTDRGLMVPSIEHAEALSASELNTAIAESVSRCREGKASAAELTRGTFTLNNYGPLGTDGATAIVNHPEVAMLGIGRIIDRPWVVDGQIEVRKVTEMTISFDHRVTDGATASAFLTFVAGCLNDPTSALAEI
ncbi:MAG: dihydrolipoamide acetyltransferase family protein [Micrococcus sp.]|nr:dihydrolipoamide acetyltransferase family protein [Micrococcus sp.]